MIIDHNHPLYKEKRSKQGADKFNGAYYYSRDIANFIIPRVKTDRNWMTVRLPEAIEGQDFSHSIVFIHNNRNPNYYEFLQKYNDLILVCGVKSTVENMRFYGKAVYLPLAVNIENVIKYRKKLKDQDKEVAFAGRRSKITNKVSSKCDILSGMPQHRLLEAMSHYKKIYAVGRTAIQAKILGCEVLPYDERYPDPSIWKCIDVRNAAKLLQEILDNEAQK